MRGRGIVVMALNKRKPAGDNARRQAETFAALRVEGGSAARDGSLADDLIELLRTPLGQSALPPALRQSIRRPAGGASRRTSRAGNGPRRQSIPNLVSQGYSNKEIARILGMAAEVEVASAPPNHFGQDAQQPGDAIIHQSVVKAQGFLDTIPYGLTIVASLVTRVVR